jgi:hypothetical protein
MTSKPFKFVKESIEPSTNASSPFYVNLPSHEAKPIDSLVEFFKNWKYFIKSLIYYLNEIAVVKQFDANIALQLINTVQFPGYKDLPVKVTSNLKQNSPVTSANTTPTKELNKPFGSATSLKDFSKERPSLKKTKSSNSVFATVGNELSKNIAIPLPNSNFLKNPSHKRGVSLSSTATNGPSSTLTNANTFHNDVKVNPKYFPTDSLFSNIAPLLIQHHQQTYVNNIKLYVDLQNKLIPKLNTLSKTLSLKIKEIKTSLKNDSFANTELIREISRTGTVLSDYMASVEYYSGKRPVLGKKDSVKKAVEGSDEEDDIKNNHDEAGALDDPFLIKLRADYQMKKQLTLENYMFASYVNLQNIAKDLFTYVMKELNIVVDKFGKLELNQELYLLYKEKISSSATADWEYFISHNPNFLNIYQDTPVQKKHEIRYFKNLTLPYANSIHNKCIRSGLLYKKSKVMKNYTRYFYILTCNYLHEFKIDNDEGNGGTLFKKQKDKIGGYIGYKDEPIKSYNLNEYQITVKDEGALKFRLSKHSKYAHKHTFKCINDNEFDSWFGDLEELLKFSTKHYDRFALIEAKFAAKEQETGAQKPQNDNGSATQSLKDITNSTSSHDTSNGTNTTSKPTNINLGFDTSTSLSGIYEPQVKTPAGSWSTEINPFDSLVSGGENDGIVNTSGSTGSRTPSSDVGALSPTISISIPGDNYTSPDHQAYLITQQKLLQQKQELLEMQLQKLATEEPAPNPSRVSGVHLHSSNSAESMSSFLPKQLSMQMFLNNNGIEMKSANEVKPENESQLELPQVFITDH